MATPRVLVQIALPTVEAVVATPPPGRGWRLPAGALIVCNRSGVPVAYTLRVRGAGGAFTTIVSAVTLPSGASDIYDGDAYLGPGDQILGAATAANALDLTGFGLEFVAS